MKFLTGPLPQEIGSLDGVVTIDLSNNNLSETIPGSIDQCESLEKLFMTIACFPGVFHILWGHLKVWLRLISH